MRSGTRGLCVELALIRQNPVTTKDTKDTKGRHVWMEEGLGVGSQRVACWIQASEPGGTGICRRFAVVVSLAPANEIFLAYT